MKTSKTVVVLLFLFSALLLAFSYTLSLYLWGIPFAKPVDVSRFGSWSNAISAIGSSCALIVAILSLISQRMLAQASEDRRLLEEETKVFPWLSFKEVRDGEDNVINYVWDVCVRNETPTPIYRWIIRFKGRSDHLCNHLKRPLLSGENTLNLPFLDKIVPTSAPEPTLVFEGKSGRCWQRSALGVLEEVKVPPTWTCDHHPKVKT